MFQSRSYDQLKDESLKLSRQLTSEAHTHLLPSEVQLSEKRHALFNDPSSVYFITQVLDACFHANTDRRSIKQLQILIKNKIPKSFSLLERLALYLAVFFGQIFPTSILKLVIIYIQRDVRDLVFFQKSKYFEYVQKIRWEEGVNLNLNWLGEAVLSHDQASKSMHQYLSLISDASTTHLSVKLSSLLPHIDPLDFDHTHDLLKEKLSIIFRQSLRKSIPVFITLDMESFAELPLTVKVFRSTLSEPEFSQVSAGIALQAYIPESSNYQKELTQWALSRINSGGLPIKIRIVKGANLAMEKWTSVSRGWPSPMFLTKQETDHHFKKMIEYGLRMDHLSAVHIGIGSHNVFDIAFALCLKKELSLQSNQNDWILFEILEGMAPGLMRALRKRSEPVLSYCPVTSKEHFRSALAYLVRRLDEQTAPNHIIKDFIHLIPDTALWDTYELKWTQSFLLGDVKKSRQTHKESFVNHPDTPWHLPSSRAVANSIITKSHTLLFFESVPSNPSDLILNASSVWDSWKKVPVASKVVWAKQLAKLLSSNRDMLLSLMILETKKVLREADSELSEAIDFCHYYQRQLSDFIQDNPSISFEPFGVTVITSPWNFPLAIPLGGILAALLTGNTVIFKPSPEAVQVGQALIQLFWEAGFPENVLQFAYFESETLATSLITDERVKIVVLTGASQTAKLFLKWRPDLHLLAETGGKNTLIVSSYSDKDLVIQDVIQSAFGHSGQKCSALSILILPKELYKDSIFLSDLRSAAQSLYVGLPHDLSTHVSPLIKEASEDLHRALTLLDPGETWLLNPQQNSNDPCLWSPGIKMGISSDSFFYKTECFGPILGVMCSDSFDHAIELANGTTYGLTAGLHSMDKQEQEHWKASIQAGNLYINRATTGALVHRQPFGGWKQSRFGYGFKAGGPHYLLGFSNVNHVLPSISSIHETVAHVSHWVEHYIQPISHSDFFGQDNLYRFIPFSFVTIRMDSDLTRQDMMMALCSALCTAKKVYLSASQPVSVDSLPPLPFIEKLKIVQESPLDCLKRHQLMPDCILRITSLKLPDWLNESGITVSKGRIILNAKFEVLNYLKEQSISHTTHRYGL